MKSHRDTRHEDSADGSRFDWVDGRHFAQEVVARPVEHGVQLYQRRRREEERLPVERRQLVQGPKSDARKVDAVRLRRSAVELLHQEGHVLPVLHRKDVGLARKESIR